MKHYTHKEAYRRILQNNCSRELLRLLVVCKLETVKSLSSTSVDAGMGKIYKSNSKNKNWKTIQHWFADVDVLQEWGICAVCTSRDRADAKGKSRLVKGDDWATLLGTNPHWLPRQWWPHLLRERLRKLICGNNPLKVRLSYSSI